MAIEQLYTSGLVASNHDYVSSGGLMDTISDIPKLLGAGLVSGVTDIINIPTNIINLGYALTGSNERVDPFVNLHSVLGGLDEALGTSLEEYTRQHEQGVRFVGSLGSMLVPGQIGINALKYGLSGASRLGTTSLIGRSLGTIDRLGEGALATAKAQVLNGSAFSFASTTALKNYATGAGIGALEMAAFETANAIAFYQAPGMEKKTFDETMSSIMFGGALGGAMGGLLGTMKYEGLGMLGLRKHLKPLMGQQGEVMAAAGVVTKVNESMVPGMRVGAGGEATLTAGDRIASLWDDYAGAKHVEEQWNAAKEAAKARGVNLSDDWMPLFEKEREKAVEGLLQKMTSEIAGMWPKDLPIDPKALIEHMSQRGSYEGGLFFSGAEKVYLPTQGLIRSADEVKVLVAQDLPPNITTVNIHTGEVLKAIPDNITFWDMDKKAGERDLRAFRKYFASNEKNKPRNYYELSLDYANAKAKKSDYRKGAEDVPEFSGPREWASLEKTLLEQRDYWAAKGETSLDDLFVKIGGEYVSQPKAKQMLLKWKKELFGELPERLQWKFGNVTDFEDVAKYNTQDFVHVQYNLAGRNYPTNDYVEAAAWRGNVQQEARKRFQASMLADNPELNMLPTSLRVLEGYSPDVASGKITFSEASFKSNFGMLHNWATKASAKVLAANVETRRKPVQQAFEAILAGGAKGKDYQEFSAFHLWQQEAANKAGGTMMRLQPDGSVVVLTSSAKEGLMTLFPSPGEVSAYLDDALMKGAVKPLKRWEKGRPLTGPVTAGEAEAQARQFLDMGVVRVEAGPVAEWLKVHLGATTEALRQKNTLRGLRGSNELSAGHDEVNGFFKYYNPPVSKRDAPYVVVVKAAETHHDPVMAGSSYVYAAENAEELKRAVEWAKAQGYETATKTESEAFHKMMRDYDLNQAFNTDALKNDFQNRGKFIYSPTGDVSVEKTMERHVDWHINDAMALSRNQISTFFARDFDALKQISLQEEMLRNSSLAKDKRSWRAMLEGEDKPTHAERLINEVLGLQTPGTLNSVLKATDAALNKVFGAAAKVFRKEGGVSPAEMDEFTAAMQRNGFNDPRLAKAMEDAFRSKKMGEGNEFSRFVRLSNTTLATTMLRLDPLNKIVDVLSYPVIAGSAFGTMLAELGQRAEKVGAGDQFKQMFAITDQVTGTQTFNLLKSAKQALDNSIDKVLTKDTVLASKGLPGEKLVDTYTRMGLVRGQHEQIRQETVNLVLDEVHSGKSFTQMRSKVAEQLGKYVDITSKPMDKVESTVQFITADVARQAVEAAGLKGDEALGFINLFVHKVMGNYAASQKPEIFQGTVGAAVGLFQGYSARLIGRISDAVVEGDKKMLVQMAALQTGMFGMRSLPFFDPLNTYLASKDPIHKDAYSTAYAAMNREAADTLMYGMGSSLLGLNLSGRGGTEPRMPSSLGDMPTFKLWIDSLKGVYNFTKQAAAGGDVGVLFNQALQHNVFNRPLQQWAQWTAGYSSTSGGVLKTAFAKERYESPDNWLPYEVVNTMRLLGGKPLDEAVLSDAVYRWQQFRLHDQEQMKQISRAITSRVIDKGGWSPEEVTDWTARYVKSGGNLEGWNRFFKNAQNNATIDQIEKTRKSVKDNERAQQLRLLIGKPVAPAVPSPLGEDYIPLELFSDFSVFN